MASVVINGDTSGAVTISAPAVAGTTTLTLPATSGTVLQSGTTVTEAQGGTGTTIGYNGFKNRIINGAMGISQRNGTSTVTPGSTDYLTDRWHVAMSQSSKFTGAQSSTAPTGFSNSLIITSSSAYAVGASDYFVVRQHIEGFNFADCGFGTASASTITLSFWVRSSLTGAFGGSLYNSNGTRSYPFTYTINAANTFEQKTITIAGDTTGTWVGATNGVGISVSFSLGAGSTFNSPANAWAGGFYTQPSGSTSVVGTSGATFYITGVQLEKGSTATSFDYRPIGTELALCQRYYSKSYAQGTVPATNTSTGTTSMFCSSTTAGYMVGGIVFPIIMRASPTITVYTISGTAGSITGGDTSQVLSGAAANVIGDRSFSIQNTSGGTYSPTGNLIFAHWVATAEL
jgi:hypothetical protein